MNWFQLKHGTYYTSAANCVLCIHVGWKALFFGCGSRPNGYGTRLELFTPYHWFRFRWGSRGPHPQEVKLQQGADAVWRKFTADREAAK